MKIKGKTNNQLQSQEFDSQLIQSQDQSFQNSESEQEKFSNQSSPPTPAIKKFQFRKKRGQHIQNLLHKQNLQNQNDQFWVQNKYFGKISQCKDDSQDYSLQSSGKDCYDSDFNASEQNYQDYKENIQLQQVKKKSKHLIRQSKNKQKFIHEVVNQYQLLAEAAHTQYFNYLSLQKLITLEQQKKKYNRIEKKKITGPRILYIDRKQNKGKVLKFIDYGKDFDIFNWQQVQKLKLKQNV